MVWYVARYRVRRLHTQLEGKIMRHLNWLSHTQEHYRKYSIAELRHVRKDATAAARLVISGSPRQNDYLNIALYASQELKRRETLI